MVRSAVALERSGAVKVMPVPKSIDNDLWLPAAAVDARLRTARHVSVGIVTSWRMQERGRPADALGVTMGRPTGHLTLGIGKAASATCTIIPEEFQAAMISLSEITDIVEEASSSGERWANRRSVALLSKASSTDQPPRSGGAPGRRPRRTGQHPHVEIDLGRRSRTKSRYGSRSGIKVTIVDKTIGT